MHVSDITRRAFTGPPTVLSTQADMSTACTQQLSSADMPVHNNYPQQTCLYTTTILSRHACTQQLSSADMPVHNNCPQQTCLYTTTILSRHACTKKLSSADMPVQNNDPQ
ncbi:hypothetical protein Bbelb_358040 [Branchiostoma belcheri]|nr:hypothetical protein Bbelb_358040 [Branchiostoma belcheri]